MTPWHPQVCSPGPAAWQEGPGGAALCPEVRGQEEEWGRGQSLWRSGSSCGLRCIGPSLRPAVGWGQGPAVEGQVYAGVWGRPWLIKRAWPRAAGSSICVHLVRHVYPAGSLGSSPLPWESPGLLPETGLAAQEDAEAPFVGECLREWPAGRAACQALPRRAPRAGGGAAGQALQ